MCDRIKCNLTGTYKYIICALGARNWFDLAQNRDYLRALLGAVLKLQFPVLNCSLEYSLGNF